MATAHAHPMYTHHAGLVHDEVTSPPSPILTNPDLILPSRPHHASLTTSLETHDRAGSSHSHRRNDSDVSTELGVATAVVVPARLSVGPAAKISKSNTLSVYQGYEHGTPLSDIGEEETDTETIASRQAAERATQDALVKKPENADAENDQDKLAPPLRHKKRLSNISASSGDSDRADWDKFDTSKLTSDRVAADIAQARDAADSDESSRRNSKEADEELAALNDRAEKILESARKRLSHMEDNLSKARHSMVLSSSRSIPNMHEAGGFGQQPAGGLYRSISQNAHNRRSRGFPVRPNSTIIAHGRAGSDAIVASSANRLIKIPEARSASAMEYRKSWIGHLTPEKSQPSHSPSSSRSFNSPLRVLTEEDDAESPSTVRTSPTVTNTPDHTTHRGLGIHASGAVGQEDLTQLDRHEKSSTPSSLERSSSQASIRSAKELTEKMSEMKSRIAELKSKAQADNLRRRSLQSLRTSSPFNNASTNSSDESQWRSSSPAQREKPLPAPNQGSGSGGIWRSISQRSHSRHDSALGTEHLPTQNPVTPQKNYLGVGSIPADPLSARTDRNTPNLAKRTTNEDAEDADFESAVIPSNYENIEQNIGDDDEEEIYANEEEQIYLNEVLEESLHDIEPDVPIIPIEYLADGSPGEAERHEDRLDAFDYENMFLHSAMGNYTGGRKSDEESDSGSTETSRQDSSTPIPSDGEQDNDQGEGEGEGEEEEFETDEEMEAEMSHGDISSVSSPRQSQILTDPHNSLSDSQSASDRGSLQPSSQPWTRIARSNSMDSTSSTATFQTATEGGDHDDDVELEQEYSDGEDNAPDEILNWGNAPPQNQLSPLSQRDLLPSSSPLGSNYMNGHRRHGSVGEPTPNFHSSPPRMTDGDHANTIPVDVQRSSPPSPSRSRASPRSGQQHYVISNSPRQYHHSRQYSQASDLSDIEEQLTPQASTFPKNVMGPPPKQHTHTTSNASTVVRSSSKRSSVAVPTPQIPLPPSPPMDQSPVLGSFQDRSVSHRPPVLNTKPSPAISNTSSTPASTASIYPANTEILMESLIKLADPLFTIGPSTHFEELDKELVLKLLRGVGGVCDAILKAQKQQSLGTSRVTEMRGRLRAAAGALIHGISIAEGRERNRDRDRDQNQEDEEEDEMADDNDNDEIFADYNIDDDESVIDMEDEEASVISDGAEHHHHQQYEEVVTDEEDGALGTGAHGKRTSMSGTRGLEGLGIGYASR